MDNHLYPMLYSFINWIKKMEVNIEDYDDLLLAIIFHDIIYDPKRKDNEEKSVEYIWSKYPKRFTDTKKDISNILSDVSIAIIDTKKEEATTKLSELLIKFDLERLNKGDLKDLMKVELLIRKEYEFVDWETYKRERIKLLKTMVRYDNNVDQLIQYIETLDEETDKFRLKNFKD